MPTNERQIHGTNLELSQSVPPEVAAGTEIAVTVKVWCSCGCDLRGGSVAVKAAEETVATAELTECHDGRSETSGLTIKVPAQLGEYAWSILVPRRKIRGVVHKRSALPISFRTMPHATSLAVWGNPSPVVVGNPFKIKVGAKSSGACELQGAQIEIQDETGARIGVGTLGDTAWVETDALYWTEVDLTAPMKVGVASWSARFAPCDSEDPARRIVRRVQLRGGPAARAQRDGQGHRKGDRGSDSGRPDKTGRTSGFDRRIRTRDTEDVRWNV